MKKRLINVMNDDNLVSYLTKYEHISKNKVKTLIKLGFIFLNNNMVTKLPINVYTGDKILISDDNKDFNIDIVYEDNNYLIVNKENGLLTISTSNSSKYYEDTLYKRVREYVNKKKEKCFIVNRIDKETSGLVVFVKKIELKNKLQDNWNDIVKERLYVAVVSGSIKSDGKIDNYLYEDKLTFSHSTKVGGKRAITLYKVLRSNNNYTMLDINILTGRKNQIRVHFSEMGYPIVGDKKYKCKDNSIKRLCLHHYKISFIDPISKNLLSFTSNVPNSFYKLFNNN